MSQKIQLRDRKLEDREEEKLVTEHLYKKGFVIKQEKDKKVYKVDKEVFDYFKQFLIDLQDEVINYDELLNNILEDVEDHYKTSILETVKTFLTPPPPFVKPQIFLKELLKKRGFDTIEGVIRQFINNIYAKLIDP